VRNDRWILLCGTLVLLAFTSCIPEEEAGSVLDVYNPRTDWSEAAPGDGANAGLTGDEFNVAASDELASEEDPPKSGSEEYQPTDADEQDDAAEDSGGGSDGGFLIAYFDTDGHAGQGFDRIHCRSIGAGIR